MMDYMTMMEIGKRYRAARNRQIKQMRDYGLTLEQIAVVLDMSMRGVHQIVTKMEKEEKE
jgi:hypothetical protein